MARNLILMISALKKNLQPSAAKTLHAHKPMMQHGIAQVLTLIKSTLNLFAPLIRVNAVVTKLLNLIKKEIKRMSLLIIYLLEKHASLK